MAQPSLCPAASGSGPAPCPSASFPPSHPAVRSHLRSVLAGREMHTHTPRTGSRASPVRSGWSHRWPVTGSLEPQASTGHWQSLTQATCWLAGIKASSPCSLRLLQSLQPRGRDGTGGSLQPSSPWDMAASREICFAPLWGWCMQCPQLWRVLQGCSAWSTRTGASALILHGRAGGIYLSRPTPELAGTLLSRHATPKPGPSRPGKPCPAAPPWAELWMELSESQRPRVGGDH